MRHVAPHWWADFDSLSVAKQQQLTDHANQCSQCQKSRERIASARAAFIGIRENDAPELSWDHVGARIHWARSLERRSGSQPVITRWMMIRNRWRMRPVVAYLAGVAVAITVTVAVVLGVGLRTKHGAASGSHSDGGENESTAISAEVNPAAGLSLGKPVSSDEASNHEVTAAATTTTAAAPLDALWLLRRGEVLLDGSEVAMDVPLVAGQVIQTGQGAAIVQFGLGGGLAIAPHSRLEFVRLNSLNIELKIDGGLDVLVTTRAPQQQFVIVAGSRTLTVRGTAFRVRHRDGDLDVSCEHGRVDVRDSTAGENAEVSLRSLQRMVLAADSIPAVDGVHDLPAANVPAMRTALALPLLPHWDNASAALSNSRSMAIHAEQDQAVFVDGLAIGHGPVSLRVSHGRHQVATASGDGLRSQERWVNVDQNGSGDVSVSLPRTRRAGSVGNHPRGTNRNSKRVTELRRVEMRMALKDHAAAIERCVAVLANNGVATGLFAEITVSIARNGRVVAVNIGATNLHLRDRRCVLAAVSRLQLAAGPAATIQSRWAY